MTDSAQRYRRTWWFDIANNRERKMTIDDDDLDEYSRRRFPENVRGEPEQREIMNALGRYFIDHMNTDRRYSPPPQPTNLPIALNLEEELENRF